MTNAPRDLQSFSIPDPWEEERPVTHWNYVPLPIERHPLLSASGNPQLRQLTAPKLTGWKIWLEDELKLKPIREKWLEKPWQDALALLCWIEQ